MSRKWIMTALALSSALSASAAHAFSLTSPQVKPGAKIADEQVFNSWGCPGKNISPALSWSDAPKGTKSFAVTVFDPDAPTGSGFWHWAIFDIPADATGLKLGAGDPKGDAAPKGSVQVRNDFSLPGYGGPCPPAGDKPHHYIFTVYAVDLDKIDADENASPAVIGFNLHFHTLAKATLTAVYSH
jgi:hypothetical protein